MRSKQNFLLRGELSDISMVKSGKIPKTSSINTMAREALNYLENNPNPDLDYECRFAIFPSHIPYHIPFFPPNKYGYDSISIADTDLRMQFIWEAVREMAGISVPSEMELGVKRRSASYVGEDGGCYSNPAAISFCEVEGIWLSIWGTSNHLIYLCDEYEKNHDTNSIETVKKGLDTLWTLTLKKTGMADFPYTTPYLDGEWLGIGSAGEHKYNYGYILEPLIRYYELTKDEEYKRRAIMVAEAFVNCMLETRGVLEINPKTGYFEKHVHTHTRCALTGMCHLAYLTKDSRYIQWCRHVYDFMLSNSPGFGWYPEVMPAEAESETCVNGDMMWSAYYLALCGELDLYEEMERNWRNYLRVTQFFVTPDIKDFLRLVHKDKTEKELEAAFCELKKLEGGFIAQVTWNDLTQRQYFMEEGKGDRMLYMMGCCPPSAMLALYFIRKAAAIKKSDGIYINMSVTADTKYANLFSDYESDSKLSITAKESADYYIRVPEWTDYESVTVKLNSKELNVEFDGPQCRYISVKNVKSGDIINVDYPLVRLTQRISQTTDRGTREFTYKWLGNSVLEVSPKAKYIDLFGEQRGIHK